MLLLSLGGTMAMLGIGSLVSRPARPAVYASVSEAAWTVPVWLLTPYSLTVCLLAAIALWCVWRDRGSSPVRWPVATYAATIVFTSLWGPVEFALFDTLGEGAFVLGLVLTVLLCGAAVATFVQFRRVNAVAGWMFAPYLAFAAYLLSLSIALVVLN